ncbi:MAG: hypothetical protein EOM26_05320 [Alphaproteobacteria bacterium]|nr:hypothetical protein [Alphaproteobacteria bacterium]
MNNTTGFVFVAGAALLDIVSHITECRHIQDNVGRTTLSFGGVAYNLAVNLKTLGVPAKLMTALNDRALAKMILHELGNVGVVPHVLTDPKLPDQVYSGIFYKEDQIASVWNDDIERIEFGGAFMEDGIEGASCVVIANDLSRHTTNTLIRLAGDRGIPVFIGNVSMMGALRLGDIEGKRELIFINNEEIDAYIDYSDHLNSWEDAARELGAPLLITKGANGVLLLYPDGETIDYPIRRHEVSGTPLGAGDLFMATTIKFIMQNGQKLEDAIEYSLSSAPTILSRDDANIGRYGAYDEVLNDMANTFTSQQKKR